jgi:predicted RNA-binding protein
MKTLISKELYESYKKENDRLLEQICLYEDDNDIPAEIVNRYKKVSRALIDYERAYHPLPGRVSTIIQRKTTVEFECLETV